MEAFTLDTTGVVRGPGAPRHADGAKIWRWDDLDAFAQGYVEALLVEFNLARFERLREAQRYYVRLSFSDLAPETLAEILKDCERLQADRSVFFNTTDPKEGAAGARCWRDRQNKALPGYAPLALYLGDDGKVYLSKAEASLCGEG